MTLDDILREGRQYVQQGDFQKALYYYRYARKDLANQIDRDILDEAIEQIESQLNGQKKKEQKQEQKQAKKEAKQKATNQTPRASHPKSGFPLTFILILIILALTSVILYGGFYILYPSPNLKVKSQVEETVDNLKELAEDPIPSKMPMLDEILTKSEIIKKAIKISEEGDRLFIQKQYRQGELKYLESLKVFKLPGTLVNLAAVYLRQDRMDEAQQQLDTTLELLKDDTWMNANPEVMLDRREALGKIYVNLAYLYSKRIGKIDYADIAHSQLDDMVKKIHTSYGYAKSFQEYIALAKQYEPSFQTQDYLSQRTLKEVKRDMVLSVRAILKRDARQLFPGSFRRFEDLVELKDRLPASEQYKAVHIWEKAYMVNRLLKRVKQGVD